MDKKKAIGELKAARRHLEKVYRDELAAARREGRKPEENQAYWDANGRVIEAEKRVPWWRR